MTSFGRKVLSWTADQGAVELRLTDVWEQKVLWEKKFDGSARPWLVDQRAIGVLDQQGRFQLFSLPDGKNCVDAKLEPDPALSEIYVLASPTHWLLATNRPMRNVDGVVRQALPGGYGNPLINGFVHIFDRQTGQKVASTRVEQHGLLLSQPSDLPVFAFATTVYDPINGRGRNQQTSLLFLDKRSGRVVYEGGIPNPIPDVDLIGDPERNQVALKTPYTTVTLTFTGQPYPPQSPADAPAKKPGDHQTSAAARAMFRGLQKWAGVDGGQPAAPVAGPQAFPVPIELPPPLPEIPIFRALTKP